MPFSSEGSLVAASASTHAAILGQLAEGVIVANTEGRITLVNRAAAEIHGVARLDIQPEDYSDTYHLFTEAGDPYPPLELPLARAVRGEVVIQARWRIRRPDGSEVLAVGNAQPLKRGDGEQIGAVLTFQDDTARESAQQALRRMNEELAQVVDRRTAEAERAKRDAELAQAEAERASAAKSDFLASMSHEIRTPLNGVIAVAEMLTRAGLPERERSMAEIIRASGDALQRLLSDILDMARIESGKVTIESAAFHVGDMLRAIAGLSQLRCDEKGVRLFVDVAPEIDEIVLGDAVRVRQIITNLLSNAVKFTERGDVKLAAERLENGCARFTVTDTGIGFAMTDKPKVLGRFEQANSSIARRYGGTGLGLSICCNLAGLMGGALDCESELGEGSRFWIELPLKPAVASTVPQPVRTVAELEAPAREIRVLLADDHPTNRRVVQLMLGCCGADLTSTEDGAQALKAFEAGTFDVVLMDMQMPVMDGLTSLRCIRSWEREHDLAPTPVIVLSADALPDHVEAAMTAGADLHLAKPFTAGTLFEAIGIALGDSPESVTSK